MPLIRLTLEYDGTDFVGWQYQTNGRSIQEEVEKALKQILQADIRISGGSRTDAGVHARGQVASFFVERDIELATLAYRLNSVLPHSIVIRNAVETQEVFNARYNAKSRRYTYSICQDPTALFRLYCWHVAQDLNLDLMQQCARQILGTHSFRSFCKVPTDNHNHRCTILASQWHQKDKFLKYEITANRFLHGMVRTLVGTMVNVGRGHTPYEEFQIILESEDRSFAGMSAPAKGLVLEEIYY
jgi:tRNA pseudouridine38-40 synthase